ncbi:MAG TPA: FAD:protein FMN transferase [Longimicrobium sp.]|nr:FAD:protein FMN transferase [Longimicrobium sp.]
MVVRAAAVLLIALAACTPPPSPAPVVDESEMGPRYVSVDTMPGRPPVLREWPVMGSLLRISVWHADTARALAAMEAARAAVFRVDSLTSVEHAGGEVAAANRRAGSDSATVLSPWTADVLGQALAISAASSGALDVTAGPLVDAWASHRARNTVPTQALRDSIAARVGWEKVRFDRATRQLRMPVRGMRMDLSAIARGYAVDRAVEALRAGGVASGLVDLGGRFRVFGVAPVGPRWILGLQDPRNAGEVFASALADSGGVAVVGSYEHFYVAGDARYSTVFDPRARHPARGVVAVYVLAPAAATADALASALYVLGPEAGCRYAIAHPGVEAVWVRDTGARGEKEGHDEALDPELVVITDGLATRLEILGEEPLEDKPTPCSALLQAH